MSDESTPPAGDASGAGEAGEPELSAEQQEMLRRMEEEMRRVSVQDLLAQSVVSILNLSYRRLAKEDERDLEQARIGIDAVRALVEHLDEEPQREVRNALSQVQMAYAQLAGGESGEQPASPSEPQAGQEPQRGPERGAGGGGKRPPGLWVPGSD